MGQRQNAAGLARLLQRRKQGGRAAKKRRPPNNRDPYNGAYGSPMSDAPSSREDWASYLKRMTSRPGWSVARLARESGVNRATIFKWIAGRSGVNVASVRQIADALRDDPAIALRAAGNVQGQVEPLDADVRIIMRRLVDPDVSEAEKATIRATLRYLADLADRQERGEDRRRDAS